MAIANVFIVNYVYRCCTGTVLILLKFQLNLQSLKLNSVYLVLGFGVGLCWFSIVFLPGFKVVFTRLSRKPSGFWGICPGI